MCVVDSGSEVTLWNSPYYMGFNQFIKVSSGLTSENVSLFYPQGAPGALEPVTASPYQARPGPALRRIALHYLVL